MPKPIALSYWVEPGKLLAGEYPQVNDDQDPPTDHLDALLEFGVTAFLDLTEESELEPYAARLDGRATHERFPIVDHQVPEPHAMLETLDAIDGHTARGDLVYLHCMAGVGRTGTTVGCWLARHLGDGQAAYDRLLELWAENPNSQRWPSPLTRVQLPYVLGWREQ